MTVRDSESVLERLRDGLTRFYLDSMHLHERAMADPFECEAWVQDQIQALLVPLTTPSEQKEET